jgi:hypothetical protein
VVSIAVAMVLVSVGIPNLEPLPLTHTLFLVLLSAVFSLVVNDSIKSSLVKKSIIAW